MFLWNAWLLDFALIPGNDKTIRKKKRERQKREVAGGERERERASL